MAESDYDAAAVKSLGEYMELAEVLAPFALFASWMMERDDVTADIATHGHQHCCVGAFQQARQVMIDHGLLAEREEPGDG